MTARALPAVLVARLGLPALGGLVFVAVLILAAACWEIGSEDRTARLSRVLPPIAKPDRSRTGGTGQS